VIFSALSVKPSILTCSLARWLDETPASRIIARFTQDLDSVDIGVTETFSQVCDMVVLMFSKLAGPVIFTPIFLIPGLFIAALGMFISNLYLRAQMSVKRHMRYVSAINCSHTVLIIDTVMQDLRYWLILAQLLLG
jgi:ABC-type multidrug transport system fused ATPase/permease subunit